MEDCKGQEGPEVFAHEDRVEADDRDGGCVGGGSGVGVGVQGSGFEGLKFEGFGV